MKEEDAVYDVVDEKEYAERVKGRVEEGFIVDDDGEYVEDGRYVLNNILISRHTSDKPAQPLKRPFREIFDEDADDETSASGGKYKGPREAKRKKEEEKKKRRGNIKNMLMNMGGGSSGKQKGSGGAAAGIKDDDVLESLLGDMKSSTTKAKPGSAAGKRKATSPPEKAPTGNKGGIQ